jgi:hypothetical protein
LIIQNSLPTFGEAWPRIAALPSRLALRLRRRLFCGRCSPGKNRKRAGERINGIDRQDRPPRHQEISNHIMPELLDRYNLSDPFNLKPNDF